MAQIFGVTYEYVPNMEERRSPHRPAHLAWLKQPADGVRLLLAGAFADPVDSAWLVVRADHALDVRSWLLGDPYCRAGLIDRVGVRQLNLVVGGPEDG